MKQSSFLNSRFRLSTGAFLFAALLAFAGSSASAKGVANRGYGESPGTSRKSRLAAAMSRFAEVLHRGGVESR